MRFPKPSGVATTRRDETTDENDNETKTEMKTKYKIGLGIFAVLASLAITGVENAKKNPLLFAGAVAAAPMVRRGTKTAGTKTEDKKDDKADDTKSDESKTDDADDGFSEADVQKMVSSALTAGLQQELPKHLKSLVTEDSIKAAINAAFKEHTKAAQKTLVSKEDIGTIVTAAAKAQMSEMRKDPKFVQNPEDAERRDGKDGVRGERLEEVVSFTKGNLPLHAKQFLNVLMRKNMNEGIDQALIDRGVKLGEKTIQDYRGKAQMLDRMRGKAITSTGSAAGDELVHRDLSSELQRQLYLSSDLAALMMAREIDMPSQPYDFPLSITRPSFYLQGTENTASDPSTPSTGTITLDAKKLMGKVEYSYEAEEDAIIPILPWLQTLLAEGAADAWEHAMINGDSTATHQDTDEEALTDSPAFAFKGFRKLALAIAGLKTDITSGGINEANVRAIRKLLKKYAADPRKLIWLASPTTALALQAIDSVVTLEKYGARATILTGELASLFGIPIVVSERMREDLDATGVNGASGNTKSALMCVRLDRFMTGRRREFTVETDRNIETQKNIIVASFRKAFTPTQTPSASITSVGIGYNFTP